MAIFPRAQRLNADGQPLNPRLAWSRVADRQVDEVIGLCKGVLSDGSVNQGEAEFLLSWLDANRDAADLWPANVIYPRIQAMLADGILDAQEEQELIEMLITITGTPKIAATGSSASSTLPLCDPAPPVVFEGALFCLTGQFACGTRAEVQQTVIAKGGRVCSSPTSKTSFLVVGEAGSRDWIHSTFGRKIEKAVEMREGGGQIAIIAEQWFLGQLDTG